MNAQDDLTEVSFALPLRKGERYGHTLIAIKNEHGYEVATARGVATEAIADEIVRRCNSHDELVVALMAAERLAWEVGCETEDGVMTLLGDSRGDLYRQISAALAKADTK